MDMIKTEKTIPLTHYVVTAVSVPLTVTSIREDGSKMPLLTVENPGQYFVVALTDQIELSCKDALLTSIRPK